MLKIDFRGGFSGWQGKVFLEIGKGIIKKPKERMSFEYGGELILLEDIIGGVQTNRHKVTNIRQQERRSGNRGIS